MECGSRMPHLLVYIMLTVIYNMTVSCFYSVQAHAVRLFRQKIK